MTGWQRSTALAALSIALVVAGCASAPAGPTPEVVALERRLQAAEARLDSLERFVAAVPAPPLRPRDEIEAHVRTLEARRAEMLLRYTPAHPAVREIDLSLRLLRLQLEVLDQAAKAPK